MNEQELTQSTGVNIMIAKAIASCLLVAGALASTTFAGVCAVPVPGEVFCDDFGADSSSRWINSTGEVDTHLAFVDGIAKLYGTFVPEVKPIGGSRPDISIQAVGKLVQGGTLGVGARLDTRSYFIGSQDFATGQPVAFLALGAPFERLHGVDVAFSPLDQFVAFQFDIFGDQISYRIWPASAEMPAEPIATVKNTTLTSGEVFLWTGSTGNPPIGYAEAEFLYFRTATAPISTYSPIPEPATHICLIVGLIAVSAVWRLRRREW